MGARAGIIGLAFLAAFALTGNRALPQWQAHGTVPMNEASRCVLNEVVRFGTVKLERGKRAEEGSLRLKLLNPIHDTRPLAVIYMDGDRRFTAVWMDARNHALAVSIWRRVTSRCGVR